jgi:hypothetical protein
MPYGFGPDKARGTRDDCHCHVDTAFEEVGTAPPGRGTKRFKWGCKNSQTDLSVQIGRHPGRIYRDGAGRLRKCKTGATISIAPTESVTPNLKKRGCL